MIIFFLFLTVSLERHTLETSIPVVKNLEYQSKDISLVIIWTDCDREGEAIGIDIIEVCQRAAGRTAIEVLRAHFSALTRENLTDAINNL